MVEASIRNMDKHGTWFYNCCLRVQVIFLDREKSISLNLELALSLVASEHQNVQKKSPNCVQVAVRGISIIYRGLESPGRKLQYLSEPPTIVGYKTVGCCSSSTPFFSSINHRAIQGNYEPSQQSHIGNRDTPISKRLICAGIPFNCISCSA